MSTIGNRVRQVRTERGIELGDLAKQVGLAYSTLNDLENGQSKSSTKLHSIATALGVRAKWLETGRGPREDLDEDYDSPWSDILGYPQAVGLGDGAEAEEYAETHKLKFRSDSLQRAGLHAKDLTVYYGRGDSMEPTIRDGDAVMFDLSDTKVVDQEIYVVMWRGEYFAKRADVRDEIVYFDSDNPDGARHWAKAKRMDNPREPVQVIGRVCWTAAWHGKSRRSSRSR